VQSPGLSYDGPGQRRGITKKKKTLYDKDKTMETLFEKYRPSSFDGVLGQDKAVKKIKTLLSRSWGGRAWWVSGASGTGKTTVARIIAAQGADGFYINEFDSADQLSIAEVDKIEQDMHYLAPGKGGRAYIINEAHGHCVRRL
jgi:replication-associated recombination protein RarA